MLEEWKDIQGYEGLYQISNLGNVKSLNYRHTGKEKVISCFYNSGYLRVDLCKNGKRKKFYIHRLVAQEFIPNPDPENKKYVDHIDTVRNNNCVFNIRWVTQKENCNNPISRKNNSLSHKGNQNAKGKKHKHWKLVEGKRVWY